MRPLMLFLATAAVVGLSVGAGVAGATPSSGVSAQTLFDFTLGGQSGLVQRLTVQPGGTTGWHSHGGPTRKFVLSGTGTLYFSDCKPRPTPAGSVILERPGEVSVLRNETTEPLVFLVFARLSGGAALRIDQPAPAGCAVR